MIEFLNLNESEPYIHLHEVYLDALAANQRNIEAISISSYDPLLGEVNSRFVNLKFIKENKFYFFTNYESPKANQFEAHSQISAILFWNEINTQIRMKAKIYKASNAESDKHFYKRNIKKNALAISSDQSSEIDSYESVIENFEKTLKKVKSKKYKRPIYWGGYYFVPYFFEFWQGHSSRINQRSSYVLNKNECWDRAILQP